MSFVPYLFFDGTCEEALNFYAEVFGGTVVRVMRYSDMPQGEGPPPPGKADQVMNAELKVGDGSLMASDSMAETFEPPRGTGLFKGYEDLGRATRVFARLAKGGEVHMPFAPTFWSPGFGTCRDRYGTEWMIGVDVPPDPG